MLIVLDTTRVDRLSCYGYQRKTSPNLDRLAAESVVYTRATSTSNWTLPAHASLFTGKFVTSHGAQYHPQGPLALTHAVSGPKDWHDIRARGLAAEETTLAEVLAAAGYATGAVVAGPWLKKVFGLAKGFEHHDDRNITSIQGRPAADVTERAIAWIAAERHRPFFLFLNYFDPHWPCQPPEEHARLFLPAGLDYREATESTDLEVCSALYDGEIHGMDHHIGHLLDTLKAIEVYDKTWFIVLADHGELLGEHGEMGHGNSLYQEEIHIPFFMKCPAPESRPRRTDQLIQPVDVPSLICDALELPGLPGAQGGLPPDLGHPVVAEVYPLPSFTKRGAAQAILDGDTKFLFSAKGDPLLHNLSEDPHEQNNLLAEEPERAKALGGRLERFLAGLPKPSTPAGPPKTLDKETVEALEGLGYT